MTVTVMTQARHETPAGDGRPARRGAHPVLRAAARFGDFTVTCVEHRGVRLASDAHLFARTPGTARLCIVLGGKIRLTHHAAQTVLSSRDAVVLQPDARVGYASDGPARVLLCDVPAATPGLSAVRPGVPFVVARASIAVPSALGAFLLDLLRQDARGITAEGRHELATVLQPMVSSTVTAIAVAGAGGEDPELRRQTALRVIATSFTDPSLNSAAIAERLGLSRRTLQRLFEDDERSVKQHIHDVRTQHAIAHLGDPRFARTSVDEIAALTGFGSAVVLRRAVIEATGRTPSELRSLAYDAAVA